MQSISQDFKKVIKDLFSEEVEVELTRPDEQFGDFATNVALRLSKQLGQNPREVAQQIVDHPTFQGATLVIAGPGFINITVSDEELKSEALRQPRKTFEGKVIVAEYSDPNPFKLLHAGHLYTSIVGDAIANLFENAGGEVHRVNFGGDVGLHVGKTMWAILKKLGGENPDELKDVSEDARSQWMTDCYVEGTAAYDEDEEARQEIIQLNKKVYQIQNQADHESPLAQIYWETRGWSYDYFNEFYKRIGVSFEKYYPESETVELGLKTVKANLGKVYEESDGAVVFKGDTYGLHTRVFINKEGLPTYEAKDVGLIMLKKQDYNFDKSIVMTGNEQAEYMKVVLKSIEQYAPELVKATSHLTHGMVKLAGGVKMSSRKGNILKAVDVLDAAADANKRENDQSDEKVSLGAIKYSFLKNRTGGDIVYDPKESVSLQGNSGPYLQYAHARACSILGKSQISKDKQQIDTKHQLPTSRLQEAERSLLRKIGEYAEVVERATDELMPHHICTYLYELCQTFNRFYEGNRVIGDEREEVRIQLVGLYADKLKNGLQLLGIHAPEKM